MMIMMMQTKQGARADGARAEREREIGV